MNRVVEAELLDCLPSDDERAVRSRADLSRLNLLMQHTQLMARQWRRLCIPDRVESLVELGAGDGTFCLRLLRQLGPGRMVSKLTLVDHQPIVSDRTRAAIETMAEHVEVVSVDVLAWLAKAPPVTVVMANLFLHHFQDERLRRLLALAASQTMFFIACEPRRCRWSLVNSRLLGLIGCNDVTRHDAVASVRAGFTGNELSDLWPREGQWKLFEEKAGWFSHEFAARRQGSSAEP